MAHASVRPTGSSIASDGRFGITPCIAATSPIETVLTDVDRDARRNDSPGAPDDSTAARERPQ